MSYINNSLETGYFFWAVLGWLLSFTLVPLVALSRPYVVFMRQALSSNSARIAFIGVFEKTGATHELLKACSSHLPQSGIRPAPAALRNPKRES